MLIAVSKLWKHGVNYPLQHIFDDAEFNFEVQLEPSGSGNPEARLGADPFEVEVDGLVSKTAWPTLTLPEGVKAGMSFPLTFRGKEGLLTIGAAPDDQHPKVKAKLGEEFKGIWRADA